MTAETLGMDESRGKVTLGDSEMAGAEALGLHAALALAAGRSGGGVMEQLRVVGPAESSAPSKTVYSPGINRDRRFPISRQ